jgi:hypothetical protein
LDYLKILGQAGDNTGIVFLYYNIYRERVKIFEGGKY